MPAMLSSVVTGTITAALRVGGLLAHPTSNSTPDSNIGHRLFIAVLPG